MIATNTVVRVSTRDGEYIGRVIGHTFEQHPRYDIMYADRSIDNGVPAECVRPTGGSVCHE